MTSRLALFLVAIALVGCKRNEAKEDAGSGVVGPCTKQSDCGTGACTFVQGCGSPKGICKPFGVDHCKVEIPYCGCDGRTIKACGDTDITTPWASPGPCKDAP
jgi:hypothetical protein